MKVGLKDNMFAWWWGFLKPQVALAVSQALRGGWGDTGGLPPVSHDLQPLWSWGVWGRAPPHQGKAWPIPSYIRSQNHKIFSSQDLWKHRSFPSLWQLPRLQHPPVSHQLEGSCLFSFLWTTGFPRSIVPQLLHFPKCRELSSLPAGQAGAKKKKIWVAYLCSDCSTLGTFWNFQTRAVFVGEKKREK